MAASRATPSTRTRRRVAFGAIDTRLSDRRVDDVRLRGPVEEPLAAVVGRDRDQRHDGGEPTEQHESRDVPRERRTETRLRAAVVNDLDSHRALTKRLPVPVALEEPAIQREGNEGEGGQSPDSSLAAGPDEGCERDGDDDYLDEQRDRVDNPCADPFADHVGRRLVGGMRSAVEGTVGARIALAARLLAGG